MTHENPFAPPKSDINQPTQAELQASAVGLWREAGLLVSENGLSWPNRCVVCNEPADGFRLKRQLFWHHSWVYLLILVNILVYALIAMIVRKRGVVHVGLCPRHRTKRVQGILIGWLGLLASIALAIVGFSLQTTIGGVFAAVGLIGCLGCPAAGIIMSQVVSPRRIDNTHLWLKVGRPFLESWPDSR